MHIEIITTPNEMLKESGFGSLKACNSIVDALRNEGQGHSVRLNTCSSKDDLEDIVKRNPELVILAVKYIHVKNEDDILLYDFFSMHNIYFYGS